MEHWDAIAAERRALADEVESLTPEQWATRSLCGEWTVQQVIGHLVMPHETSLLKFALQIAKARGNFDKANVRMSVRAADRPTADLVAALRRHAEGRFTPPGFTSAAPLTDVLVHGYDIRIPLGMSTSRSPEPFRHALDFVVTPKAQRAVLPRGLPPLRFVATDVDWAHGTGDEVRGSAADLALTMTGRRARIDALEGPGAAEMVAWAKA
jgi:uncharacterized protein (TIGR03083 family)